MNDFALVRHVCGVFLAAVLTLGLLYASRFWTWTAPWGEAGLLGVEMLSRDGDIVRNAVGGTPFAEFDIMLWGLGGIAMLSTLQWLIGRIGRR